jgi:hypothetical protein
MRTWPLDVRIVGLCVSAYIFVIRRWTLTIRRRPILNSWLRTRLLIVLKSSQNSLVGLPADMISNLVNQGCRFTPLARSANSPTVKPPALFVSSMVFSPDLRVADTVKEFADTPRESSDPKSECWL